MTDNNFLRSFRSVGEIFRPPFEGLWLVSVLYVLWAWLVYSHSPVLRGEFPDTDDYMYLQQMLDWMKGQGWYDNVQHRLDPPAGVPIHFSRFVMLPMAAITGSFELLGLGPKGAATVMAMIYPIILLGFLLIALRWVAERFMPKEWAGVTGFVGLFASSTIYLFQPGHVDHHNLMIILEIVTLGCALQMMLRPEARRWPVLAGLVMVFAMMAALEVLPWLLLLSAYLGLWATVKGEGTARSGFLYALSLFIGSAIGLLLTRPPHDLLNLDVLTYSIDYVILAGGIAVSFAGVFMAARVPLAVRIAVGALLAAVTGFLFLHRFPELMAGPYGGIDPALAHIILDEISEAQPMKFSGNTWLDVFWTSATAFVAIAAGLCFLKRATVAERWLWGLLMLMLVAMAGLTFLYQRRFTGIMSAVAVIPLAVLLQRGWAWIGAHWRGRKQFYAELGLILLVGPLPAVLMPAIVDGRSFSSGVLMFPVQIGIEATACQTYELENALRDPLRLGNRQRLIMNPLGVGPEILFRTRHQVLAAPFHMDVAGNLDSTRFFSTPYPEEAEAIARRRHVDIVLTCTYAENFYFHNNPWKKDDNDTGPGKDFAPHFIERLVTGHIPAWLKPVKVPGLTNYVIYEVLPPVPETKPTVTGKKSHASPTMTPAPESGSAKPM